MTTTRSKKNRPAEVAEAKGAEFDPLPFMAPGLCIWSESAHKDKAAWLERRRTSYGASDAPAAAGLSVFKTPMELWLDKLGCLKDKATSSMKAGNDNENRIVLGAHAQAVAEGIVPAESTVHPFHHTIGNNDLGIHASPDGIIVLPDGSLVGIEAKWTSNRKTWGETPEMYVAQCVWSMHVTGLKRWILGMSFGKETEVKIDLVRIEDHEELLSSLVSAVETHRKCVDDRVPPGNLWNEKDPLAFVRAMHPIGHVSTPQESVLLDEEIQQVYLDAIAAKAGAEEELRKAESRLRLAQAMLLDAAHGAEKTLLPNGSTVIRKLLHNKGHVVEPYSYETMTMKE